VAYQITYRGPAPLARTLVESFKEEGVTVDWTPPDEPRDLPDQTADFMVALAATGTYDAVRAAVGRFQREFGNQVSVRIDPDPTT